jgi:hypothetical protein
MLNHIDNGMLIAGSFTAVAVIAICFVLSVKSDKVAAFVVLAAIAAFCLAIIQMTMPDFVLYAVGSTVAFFVLRTILLLSRERTKRRAMDVAELMHGSTMTAMLQQGATAGQLAEAHAFSTALVNNVALSQQDKLYIQQALSLGGRLMKQAYQSGRIEYWIEGGRLAQPVALNTPDQVDYCLQLAERNPQ